jgi:hypothetical protein
MGATKLEALLITMSKRPTNTILRLGQIIVLKAVRILTFLSDILWNENLLGIVVI